MKLDFIIDFFAEKQWKAVVGTRMEKLLSLIC